MQSGITASSELTQAFNEFTSDPSLFALPVTISGESLTPEPPVPFTSGADDAFTSSLPSLKSHVQPKTPKYLILRPTSSTATSTSKNGHNLTIITYVPSSAPVRSKMLFASTRNTLVRDLGIEKFGENLFVTDDYEILDPKAWESRSGANGGGNGASGARKDDRDNDILTREERELQSVKRAEEEERHGTQGRDLMGDKGSGRLAMKITDEAKASFSSLSQEGAFVQLGIEMSSETLDLVTSETSIQPGQFLSSVPGDRPSYSFYRYPGADSGVVFLYTCPGGSKVKERMVYASARASVLQVAKSEGVDVTKRLEQGDNDEVTEDRLRDEVGLKTEGGSGAAPTSKQGFAKPKRPGKR